MECFHMPTLSCVGVTTINLTFSSLRQETLCPRTSLVSVIFLALGNHYCTSFLSPVLYVGAIMQPLSCSHWFISLKTLAKTFSMAVHGTRVDQHLTLIPCLRNRSQRQGSSWEGKPCGPDTNMKAKGEDRL